MQKILKPFYPVSNEWVDGLRTIGVVAVVALGTFSASGLSVRSDGARRFVDANTKEEDIANGFKDTLKGLAEAPKMKPVLTVPHELDCLIESGHIQGACCSEQGVYLSHARGLEKIGWDGKLIKHVDASSHLGDCAYADGKIYGAFVIRDKTARKDGKKGLVRVWDENLNVLKEAWFDEALDGIVVLGDTVYVGVDRWGKKSHPLCCVKRLDLNLKDLGNTDVDLGYDIAYGVQTMATDGKDLFFGNYGGTSRVSADLKENARIKFRCSEGFGLVPKSVIQSDANVFFAVRAMGDGMKGWRKDPENNPPRIRLDFFEFKGGNEFKDGKFVDISISEEAETFTFTKAPGNDGGKYCRFQVPFNADLSACDGFEFDYRISDIKSSGRLVVFAGTSSNESYSMRVDVPTENEWTHVVLRKRDVYGKSTTNGWAKIVRITLRYSVCGEKGFTAQLRNLRPLPTPDPAMAILFAEDAPRGETGTKSRRKVSFAADRLGLGSFYLSDHDLARGIPPNMKILFVGRQKPIPEATAMIEKFRAAGGKVVTWRKLPPTLDADLERLAREHMPGAEVAIAQRKAELEVIAQAERQAIAKIPNTGRPGERRKISCHVPTGHGSLTNWEENVKLIKACGFNTLSVNLCRGIYAAYKSKVYKPWPGKSGTDMLEVIKAVCNRHGINFVAWRCCWATPDWLTTKEDLEARRAAGRMVVLKNGELLTKGGCPTHPENIRQEIEGLIELAHKGVSGVNLDFIRYPGEGGCFCARCRSLFEKRIGRTVAKWPDDLDSDAELNSQWIDFRADNITYVVKTVGEYIHKNTPGVMVSVSGFDNPVIARTIVGQDWPYWCRQGWVDVAGMMDYRDTLAEYKDLISRQCSIDVGKAKRSTSIGPSCWGKVEQPALLLAQMIQAAREAGFDGWSVFDFDERTAKLLPLLATGPTKPVDGGENALE